ncbi:sensor domain-containing protein [Mycobacterium branderi]|uniref:Sensor domain-containing protein n=1 Tax=Mycobacterium branderi TaxID=43348 RepID=A0A7I7WGY2_9MYCO|nr:sensor domain-containing protein [Mycobacterium branderi]MCV7236303.1 sensor domain-containing protein [Mycobacterium branderi]ORA35474.1 hypothetical protein BST20_17960 [Mycobacterium branderi]BBZ15188.1 sensor domain-containing protein [Mycobacterium branderi]
MSALRSALSAVSKSAAVLCCVVIAMSACSRPAATSASPSPPAPSTRAGTPAAPAPELDADTLLVSVEDTRRIANNDSLQQADSGVAHRPAHFDSDAPPPCQAANDQQATFGTDWQQFRSAAYTAVVAGPSSVVDGKLYPGANKMLDVVQSVGVYSPAAARAAFERLIPTLKACAALHVRYHDYTVNMPDPDTVVLTYPDPETSSMFRVKSSVLMQVWALGFPNSQDIAQTIVQTITDRIPQ